MKNMFVVITIDRLMDAKNRNVVVVVNSIAVVNVVVVVVVVVFVAITGNFW